MVTVSKEENVYLLLGSNLGDKQTYLKRAKELIQAQIGVIIEESHLYETSPWLGLDQDPYLNQAIRLTTSLSPEKTLSILLDIEKSLGRKREKKNESRNIDIDLILWGQRIIDSPDLKIPHPRMNQRSFVLIPLMEIAAEEIHPIEHKSIEELYELCADLGEVVLLDEK
ncbi:MAG: 2-amino-4-hydroxy-6-hydroxymethyldihydropteridine diphosphokinase [Bacteroidota bacterium]|nr:2-amino-4-hydroxy-6-hydroxymethyldihydropteridine diphosphokinase [Bacteroidota bacterium]